MKRVFYLSITVVAVCMFVSCGRSSSNSSSNELVIEESVPLVSQEEVKTEVQEVAEPVVNTKKWDETLDSYEKYIDQYIKLYKKAMTGDASALTEYASMMEKATEFAEKLEEAGDDLTTTQMNRFIKLQTKLSNTLLQ